MPSPNPTVRREYNGGAVPTTLSGSIASGVSTTFTLTSTTNWPTGSTGVFTVTINRGQSDEERILCSSRSGSTVTVNTRGYDNTTAQAHSAGATVECTLSGVEADEWNAHTNATSAVHGVTGSLVGTSDAQTLTNKTLTAPVIAAISNSGTVTLPTGTRTLVARDTTDTLTNKTLTSPAVTDPTITGTVAGGATFTSPTINGATINSASSIGGVLGSTLADERTSWTTYTPSTTGLTGATLVAAYKQIGKVLHLRVKVTVGTTSATTVTLSLPVGFTAAAGQTWAGAGAGGSGTANAFTLTGGASTVSVACNSGVTAVGLGFTVAIEVT